jgi:hypothetical protein
MRGPLTDRASFQRSQHLGKRCGQTGCPRDEVFAIALRQLQRHRDVPSGPLIDIQLGDQPQQFGRDPANDPLALDQSSEFLFHANNSTPRKDRLHSTNE